MQLNTAERLTVLSLFVNTQGSLEQLRVVRELTTKVGFTSEELEASNLRREEERGYVWDTPIPDIDIEIGEAERKAMLDQIELLSKNQAAIAPHLALYERLTNAE